MDVTIRPITERVSFTLSEADEVDFMQGLALTIFEVRGLPTARFEVEEMREATRALLPGGGRITLEAASPESSLAMKGNGLRLMGLTLPARTRVTLSADQEGQVFVGVGNARGSRLEVGLLSDLSVAVKDFALKNARGQQIPFSTADPVHRLEVKLPSRNLILEPEGEVSFTLVLKPAGQPGPGESVGVLLGITPRLKVASLDFTRREGTRVVPAIRRLWVDPLVPENRPLETVFLGIPADKVFTLQSVGLSGGYLACELTGRINTLRVGKDEPRENLAPSLLQYLVNHVVFRAVCKPAGLC
jgi:hypothetical protein